MEMPQRAGEIRHAREAHTTAPSASENVRSGEGHKT